MKLNAIWLGQWLKRVALCGRNIMLDAHAVKVLTGRYTYGSETAEDTFKRVARYFGTDAQHSERLLKYFEKLWLIPASPVLANGGTGRGNSISCFLTFVPDSREGLSQHFDEILWMGTGGGGIASHYNHVRSAGQKTSRGTVSTGAVQFMHIDDAYSLACSQGTVRQASNAIWLQDSHPEILEFLQMRRPTGGDLHRKNLNLHHGVSISDAFMEAVLCDEEWQLIDPHSQEVVNTVQAREVWQTIIETRMLTGEPYICFVDECNRKLHPDLREQGLTIYGSNLCCEVLLPTNKDRTAVCCLSSLNLELFDEWKDDPIFIQDALEYLDNILSDFIQTAPSHLSKAVYSAIQERSVGLGTMGFHSYLQRNMVPFGSIPAVGINLQIFEHIDQKATEADAYLCALRGPAAGLKSSRFAHKTAIAPNASTAIIAGTSPSIEPWPANIFVQKTISGSLTMRNKYLDQLFREKAREMGLHEEQGVESFWRSVLENGGSVQHLSVLSDWEKEVFKTAYEINQFALIKLAADRQKHIDQGQSLNLFFPAGSSLSYINKVHIEAWRQKCKTLYYVRTIAERKGQMVSFDQNKECFGCSG
jgi:ribonucleoside-diphosphate reductase alpha chain